ncbi:pyridoxal phosphate-dependent aminotransferase [Candidatus Micrarchaeota archaeon]|nr:pyridoxal phosphate-dependent aminotransferase [Candidatus Micrarchaeota archaeon]
MALTLYQLSEKIFELEKQGKKILRLNIGDPGLVTPDALRNAAKKSLDAGETRYASAQGEKPLLDKIASTHGAEAQNVSVTPGSKWACYAVLQLMLKPGDNIVTPAPFWSAYELMAKSFGAECRLVKTEMEDHFQFDPQALFELVDAKTKVIVLNDPSNPTSTEYGAESVKAVLEYAQDQKILVLLDEAYRDLSFKKNELMTYQEGLAITTTFSKAYCMSGWRAGYLVADADVIKKVVSLNQITFTNVPRFTQAAMLEGLTRREEVTGATRNECKKRLAACEQVFKGIQYARPDAGFYFFPKVSDGDSITEKILEQGIAVTPGSVFGGYKQFIRLSLSHPLEKLTPALQTIRRVIDENA